VRKHSVHFDDNQCVEEIRGQRSKRDTDFGRKYLSVLESPVIISIGNNERAVELLTNIEIWKAIHSTAIISPSVSIAEVL
jgi:hypothetical protein